MRYQEESRVNPGSRKVDSKDGLTPAEVAAVRAILRLQFSQEPPYPAITADQNDFKLARGIIHRLNPSGATRTITGFRALDLDSTIKVIVNVGIGQNLVLAHNNAGSEAENRILCFTDPSNITIAPNQFAFIFYDRTSARVRAR